MERWPTPFLPHLIEHTGLQPNWDVLDVGCGLGHIADELFPYLDGGSYVGFDIRAAVIEKMVERYAALPHFRFLHADLRSGHYNPDGAGEASDYSFPVESASADLVILRSVFTHMLPEQVVRYLGEIKRVRRPGGVCYATWFLVNEQTRGARSMNGRTTLPYDHGVYWTKVLDTPERGVGFEEDFVRAAYDQVGLVVKRVVYGGWGQRQGVVFQDEIVAV